MRTAIHEEFTADARPVAATIAADARPAARDLRHSAECKGARIGTDRKQYLETTIRQRIESRLPGRLRNLMVRVTHEAVVLEGECATYYTKQLAQHAALGVLEDEPLENAIVVRVPR